MNEVARKVIEMENLSFSYSGKYPALKNIDLNIESREAVGLIGANGAGKSTLLKLLVGLLEGYQGELRVCELPVVKKNLREIRQKTGYVFQDSESQLFLSTVYEDVAFGPRNYGLPEKEVASKVEEALQAVNMLDCKDKQVYRLSGGQKKLAAIATVLAMEPELVLFDEPSVALDPRNRRKLMQVIKDLKCTKIIASHDMEFIRGTCQRVILINEKCLVASGTVEEILNDASLLEANGL